MNNYPNVPSPQAPATSPFTSKERFWRGLNLFNALIFAGICIYLIVMFFTQPSDAPLEIILPIFLGFISLSFINLKLAFGFYKQQQNFAAWLIINLILLLPLSIYLFMAWNGIIWYVQNQDSGLNLLFLLLLRKENLIVVPITLWAISCISILFARPKRLFK